MAVRCLWGAGIIALLACGGGRNAQGPGPGPGNDGGAGAPDAARLDAGTAVDAGDVADAGGPPDAFTGGDATVVVFRDFDPGFGQPQPGVPVLFNTREGRLIASVVTDSAGKATAAIPRDASVTIVRDTGPGSGSTTILTRANVQPGAVLKFGFEGSLPGGFATLTVHWTSPPIQGVGHFDVDTPCGGAFADFNERSATFPISERCANIAFPVYVVARQNADFIVQSGVEGVTATRGATVDVPLTTWIGPSDVISTVSHVPDNVGVSGQLRQASHGLEFDDGLAGGLLTGDSELTYHMAPSPGSELREQIDLGDIGGDPIDQTFARRLPFGRNFSLDFSAAMLPGFTSAGFDIASRTWRWSTRAPVDPDIQLLYLSFERPALHFVRWSVIASGEIGNSFVLPEVPANLAAIVPLASDKRSGAVSVIKLGNGLTFAQVQANLAQWIATGFPHTQTLDWEGAPPTLTSLIKSNAIF